MFAASLPQHCYNGIVIKILTHQNLPEGKCHGFGINHTKVVFTNCYQIVIELLSNLVSLHDPFYKAKYRNIVPGTRIKTDEEVAVPRQDSN